MADPNIQILEKETFLAAIKNSVGSKQYNSLFVRYIDTDEVKDILEDGNLSCAYFVSSLMLLFGLIDRQRSTVRSVLRHLTEGEQWQEVAVKEAVAGDVVVYEEREFEIGSVHAHVGFVTDGKKAVSTSYKAQAVVQHDLEYHPVASIWRYKGW